MQGRSSRYQEFIVRVVSPAGDTVKSNPAQDQQEQTRIYDAFIYGNVEEQELPIFKSAAKDQPSELRNLPLLGAEQVVVNWTVYKKYKSEFINGEKAASEVLSRDDI